MVLSGVKFETPKVDYLTWLLEPRGLQEDSGVFIDADNIANIITHRELVDLVQRIGQGFREFGIGANGPGKDVVMVHSQNQVQPIKPFTRDVPT
jgi:hypothetical protein